MGRTMETRRVGALALSVILFASLVCLLSASTASASSAVLATPSWTVPVPSGSATATPIANPQGTVIAFSSPGVPASSVPALQEVSAAGQPIWSLPATATLQPQGRVPSVTDANGNTYVQVEDSTSGNLNLSVESLDASGNKRWIAPLPTAHQCCEIALGWNGVVYTVAASNQGAPQILGFNEATGAQVLDLTSPSLSQVTNLMTYPGGLIVVDLYAGVAYYSYAGMLITNIVPGSPGVNFPSVSAGNGTVFMEGSTDSCTDSTVEEITPGGIQWTWNSPSGFRCGDYLTATPDGGLIVGGGYNHTVISISPQGATRWTYTPTPPPGDSILSPAAPVVDTIGDVAIPFTYQDPSQGFYAVEVDFLTQSAASSNLQALNIREADCPNGYGDILAPLAPVDVEASQLLVGLTVACQPAQNTSPGSIQAFTVPGLSANFRLVTSVPGFSPPPPPPSYVALGDSFSSGEGNFPFLTGTDNSTDKCHRSSNSYPSLLSAAHPAFEFIFVACSGATTGNIWLGANPPQSIQSDPEPLQLSSLSGSTKLVTLSIGGDDIGFADIITQCVVWTCAVASRFSSEVRLASKHIRQLEPVLVSTYKQIQAAAPNAAVYVVGYPYLVPPHPSRAHSIGTCVAQSGLIGNSLGWLAPKEVELNSVIGRAATAAGVHYVDPNARGKSYSFLNHDICSSSSWIISITNRSAQNYSFHPNTIGQYELEQALLAAGA